MTKLPDSLILSLGFDDCTDTSESRESLINTIVYYLSNKQYYKQVIVVIGSFRQSIAQDYERAVLNSQFFKGDLRSCKILLTEFVVALQSKLPIPVIAETLMLGDIYTDCPIGTNFNLILQQDYEELLKESPGYFLKVPNEFGMNIVMLQKGTNNILIQDQGLHYQDNYKCLQLYFFMQYIFEKHTNNFRFLHFDDDGLIDDDGLMQILHNNFAENLSCIPKGCSLQLVKWAAETNFENGNFNEVITGIGEFNQDYKRDFLLTSQILKSKTTTFYILNELQKVIFAKTRSESKFIKKFNFFSSKNLVLSLDFDGCTDTNSSRTKLISYIESFCAANPHYTNIIVAIGSLRQSIYLDFTNAIFNSKAFQGKLYSCSVLLTDFVDNLRNQLKSKSITVIPETLMLADIFNDLEPGTTFKLINKTNYQDLFDSIKSMVEKEKTSKVMTKVKKVSATYIYYNHIDIADLSANDFQEWYDNALEQLSNNKEDFFYNLNSTFCGISEECFDFYCKTILNYHKESSEALEASNLETSSKVSEAAKLKLQENFTKTFQVTNKRDEKVVVMGLNPDFNLTSGESFAFADENKCLTLYVYFQRLAFKYGNNFDLIHFDDKEDLLNNIRGYFSANAHSIPKGCALDLVKWQAIKKDIPKKYKSRISGTGFLHDDYKRKALQIAQTCKNASTSGSEIIHSNECMPTYIKDFKNDLQITLKDGGIASQGSYDCNSFNFSKT